MKFDYTVTARWMRQRFVRHAWTTSQQKWTTSCAIGGLVLATMVTPGFGIAVFGTAFAGWWVAVILITIFSGLFGRHLSLSRSHSKLVKQVEADRLRAE
ncbi:MULTISPECIES: hypothetical protein [Bosea]|uniref:hypothetical protein n=1 Tax=Bosea TaxID=85413 RepID=UPI00215026BC|nr:MULTISPECIES: hypothetical protein [Bosea]MCR4520977.1 hypothetical protein [Bosea sp. 47.2.35]MDR6830622.1 hypothetical protein [Bosea robiniae]MDR6897503.1 hypothetical protein [Bosea sp. BE109]MDR7140900.1 hypothetical protein [Bosea sp. BE168]MDR7177580.1 hypothetical protein [Bosea sp. BE271]